MKKITNVGMLWSMNRGKASYGGIPISGLTSKVVKAYREYPFFRGLDITGAEICGKDSKENRFKAGDWQQAIALINELNSGPRKNNELLVTTHLDFRMSRSAKVISDLLKGAPTDGSVDLSVIEKMLKEYMDFVEPFIYNLLLDYSKVGHAYILYPEYFPTPLWDDHGVLGVDFNTLGLSTGLRDRITRLREAARSKHLIIEHNPIAAFRDHNTIRVYRRSMVYGMTGNPDYDGIGLKIGTDAGIFSLNRPRTLSDALARIFVSAPEDSTVTINQILGMVNCELV
jgi:hypothetical protein